MVEEYQGRHRRKPSPRRVPQIPRRACAALIGVSLTTGFFTVHYVKAPTASAIGLPAVPVDEDFKNRPANAMPIDPSLLEAPTPQNVVREDAISETGVEPESAGTPASLVESRTTAAADRRSSVQRPSPTKRSTQTTTQSATRASVTRSSVRPSPTPRVPAVKPSPTSTAASSPSPTPKAPVITNVATRFTFSSVGDRANGGLKTKAVTGVMAIAAGIGFNGTVLGYRPSATDPDGHPVGLAADFMVYSDTALGNRVAEYILAHKASLGVKYIIWRQRYNDGSGWRTMPSRGTPTANHMDHVHVTFNP